MLRYPKDCERVKVSRLWLQSESSPAGERASAHRMTKYPLELHAESDNKFDYFTVKQSRKPTVILAVYNEVHYYHGVRTKVVPRELSRP